MNKSLAALLVLGTGAALLAPPAVAYAKDGDDDRIENRDDRGGDDHRGRGRGGDDNPTSGSDDGTPDQGSGDNGRDDNPTPGSDDGTPDQGSGDGPRTGNDDGARAGERNRDRDRRRNGKVDIRRSGQCSADSVWRLRVRVKDDRSRIKFQVKTGVAGESWTYAITDNGAEVAAGTRRTHGRSGDFTIQHKRRSGGSGSHEVTAVAENTTTGETCSGAANA